LTGNGRSLEPDERFFAEQNARLVVNAERYYRAMFRGGVDSWNLRDGHMAETLDHLASHLEQVSGRAELSVGEANSDLGDNCHTRLAEQFDVVSHIDDTTALEPLERTSEWDQGELPETYPTGV